MEVALELFSSLRYKVVKSEMNEVTLKFGENIVMASLTNFFAQANGEDSYDVASVPKRLVLRVHHIAGVTKLDVELSIAEQFKNRMIHQGTLTQIADHLVKKLTDALSYYE